jgi:hypothetical protein
LQATPDGSTTIIYKFESLASLPGTGHDFFGHLQ